MTQFNYSCHRHPSWLQKRPMSTGQDMTKAAKPLVPSGSTNRKINSITNWLSSLWHSPPYHPHFWNGKPAKCLWRFQVCTPVWRLQQPPCWGMAWDEGIAFQTVPALLTGSSEHLFFLHKWLLQQCCIFNNNYQFDINISPCSISNYSVEIMKLSSKILYVS